MHDKLYIPAIILLSVLSGCVAASETLSGSNINNGMALHSLFWDDIQIGVTTKEEVRSFLGNPTDVQVSSEGNTTHESWAYVSGIDARQPFQYVLLLGALAIPAHSEQGPFAVSFSPEGIVDGFTVSQVHAQGHETYDFIPLDPTITVPMYGMKNPLAQNIRLTAIPESEN